ncbi:hypothetical protein NMY22_g18524 [Coprinellus aureogranulatus]|nr:hypothetical protein NMY22_g18524 [Coprinellus aureogranulatus]
MSFLRLAILKNARCPVTVRFYSTRPIGKRPLKEDPLTDAKPKPKEFTPLRRSASASQDIRANPTPTRGEIHPVLTLATSERYVLSRLRNHPDLPPRAQALHECWLKEPETEDLEFVVDPSEPTRLQGDLIILGHEPSLLDPSLLPPTLPPSAFPPSTLLARYTFSQALSRSTALSSLEVALDEYLTSMSTLPHELAKTGKPGMNRKNLIKKLGELMKFRQYLNLNRENFIEAPDFYWTEPELEKGCRAFQVDENAVYLARVLTESSGHSMELIIIALIAVEVILAFIREGPELWHSLTSSDEEQKPSTA